MTYKDLTVVVPVYNEADYVKQAVLDLLVALPGADILVVDNGSTDGTVKQVQSIAAVGWRLQVCMEKGKGAAMRHALSTCTRTYVLFHDADGEYAAKDSPALVEWARLNIGSMAVGNRMFSMGRPPWSSLFACGLIRWVLSKKHNVDINDHDVLTGTRVAALATWRRLDLVSKGFSIETEIVKKCIQQGVALKGLPVGYAPRSKTLGKKIRAWDLISLLRVALS
jgi:glycosyltransferase involved in cell wall biosynthesis